MRLLGRSTNGKHGRELVALVLATGLAVSIVLICTAVAINAVQHQEPLSDNATQVLTAVFGGIIGVLGSYLGFRAAERKARDMRNESGDDDDEAR